MRGYVPSQFHFWTKREKIIQTRIILQKKRFTIFQLNGRRLQSHNNYFENSRGKWHYNQYCDFVSKYTFCWTLEAISRAKRSIWPLEFNKKYIQRQSHNIVIIFILDTLPLRFLFSVKKMAAILEMADGNPIFIVMVGCCKPQPVSQLYSRVHNNRPWSK